MALMLGKNPPVRDPRTLVFGAYLKPQLPPPPPSVDYGHSVPTWPMYGNDRYGDCTCAAAGHMIQCWTANAGAEVTPADRSVIDFYEHFVGDPPPPDAGCDMLQVLKYWRRAGLDTHTVRAFTSLQLQDQVQAQQALDMFGAVYIGVALPNFAVRGDMLAVPWVVPANGPLRDAAPNPHNGHCVPAVAYDTTNLYVVTWGAIKAMSWGFYGAYADEAFAVLSLDFLAGKTTVAGFDLATLEKDLGGL